MYISNQLVFWSVGLRACRFIHFTFYFAFHAAVSLLVAMAMEKYISICYPLKTLIWISRKHSGIVILLLFLLAFTLNGHNLMFREVGISVMDNTTISCDYKYVDKTTEYYHFVKNFYTWINSTIYCLAISDNYNIDYLNNQNLVQRSVQETRTSQWSGDFCTRETNYQSTTCFNYYVSIYHGSPCNRFTRSQNFSDCNEHHTS